MNGVTTSSVFNDANQLTSRGTTSYGYDAAGNLVSSSAGRCLQLQHAESVDLDQAGRRQRPVPGLRGRLPVRADRKAERDRHLHPVRGVDPGDADPQARHGHLLHPPPRRQPPLPAHPGRHPLLPRGRARLDRRDDRRERRGRRRATVYDPYGWVLNDTSRIALQPLAVQERLPVPDHPPLQVRAPLVRPPNRPLDTSRPRSSSRRVLATGIAMPTSQEIRSTRPIRLACLGGETP